MAIAFIIVGYLAIGLGVAIIGNMSMKPYGGLAWQWWLAYIFGWLFILSWECGKLVKWYLREK